MRDTRRQLLSQPMQSHTTMCSSRCLYCAVQPSPWQPGLACCSLLAAQQSRAKADKFGAFPVRSSFRRFTYGRQLTKFIKRRRTTSDRQSRPTTTAARFNLSSWLLTLSWLTGPFRRQRPSLFIFFWQEIRLLGCISCIARIRFSLIISCTLLPMCAVCPPVCLSVTRLNSASPCKEINILFMVDALGPTGHGVTRGS